jgi:transcriptional regulator with XRE-family HTH domain
MVLSRTMTPFERKRLAAGLTQQQIADKLGLTQAAVKKWEKGRSMPSPRYFPKLARILHITGEEVTYLFAPIPASGTATTTVALA